MMTVDSTATNWIWVYYQQIVENSVTVGRWIRMWYEHIVHGLEDGTYHFDQKRANEVINFIERYTHHHEGPLAPGLIKLEVWQKAFLSVVYGIVDDTGKRQFREIVLLIGRKQGKTALLSGLGCHHLFKDGGYGARVYVCAPKLEQSRLCYEGIYQTIRQEPMMDRMTKRRRTDLYIEKNNSSAQPLAFSAKKSDGLNISMAICDEFGAWQGEPGLRQAEVVKSSQGARPEPLLFYISTANFVEGGLYDEILKRSTAVLNGTSKETRLAPFLYMIDDPEKWNDINELRKSLPNLGVSVGIDYMLEEIAVAEGSLSKKSEFLTKYCNIQQSSSLAWFTAQDVRKCFGNSFTLEDFRHSYGLGGIDLSQTTDLTAAVIVVQKGGVNYFFTHFFLPANKLDEATARDGLPYAVYVQRGLMSLSGENFVDYHDVHRWFDDLRRKYEIVALKVGYDRYSAQYLVDEMKTNGYQMSDVYQGPNLTGVLNDIEGLVKDGKLQCADDNDLMKVHMMDCALKLEANSNRKQLVKINANRHIDGMAALTDAMCMYHNHWEELQNLLVNAR